MMKDDNSEVDARQPLRVLLVEDNPADRELCLGKLREAGFDVCVDQATTPQEFTALVQTHTYDLVLADYHLPQWTGMQALELLRRLRRDLPFILVTGTLGEENMADCYRQGMTDYVLKDHLARLPIAVHRVLHERRMREERARFGEERDRFFMLSLDLLCVLGFDGCFEQMNPACERALGFTMEELAAQPFFDLVHPDDLVRTRKEFDGLIHGATATSFESRCRCKNGSYKWLHWKSTTFPSQRKIYSTARDITERKLAEERIREQAALLDKAQEAICVQDLASRIIYWNKSSERLFGWTAEEVTSQTPAELLFTKDSAPGREAYQVLLERGEWAGELQQATKDGRKVIVESRWTLVRNNEDQPRSILVINTDITARKSLEVQFLRAQRLESIGKLASGIAHDLNNVLTPILISLELLHESFPDPRSKDLLDMLQASAQHGAAMVKQILSFTRGLSGEKVIIPVRHLINDMHNMMRDTFPRTIQIETSAAKELWTIAGDPTQLHQVLMNLVVNARDAMPKGGQLNLTAENIVIDEHYARLHLDARPGPYVVISVSDSGTGIPAEVMERIFEPFYTSKENGKGTGLGLPTVLRIVKHHTGFVNVYSEPGKGTRFTVYLPAHEAGKLPQAKEPGVNLPHGSRQQILVVDDEQSFREVTRAILEKYNYRVLTACDGTEALTLYAQNKGQIDAVITDMLMPILDGPATMRALKKIDPNVRLIATSGLVTQEKLSELENAAAVFFLLKPYRTEKLLQTLRDALGRDSLRTPPAAQP